jgi:hypothetical protein
VVESGILADIDDHYVVTGPVEPPTIPMTLQASLLARLDRLAPTREVAQIGAALGRSFSHELISAVATMPEQQLDDALAQLVRAELIFRRGTPPNAEYTFKHKVPAHKHRHLGGLVSLCERGPAIPLPLFGYEGMRHRRSLRRAHPQMKAAGLGGPTGPPPIGPPTTIVTNSSLRRPQPPQGPRRVGQIDPLRRSSA